MPQGPPARTVGARLREAREKRGVSLRQISSITRISVMSLEALERSDLSRLPGGIFTRSFIRAYAQEVGLDPDRTVQDFIAEQPADAGPAIAGPAAIEDSEQLDSDRKAVTTALRLVLVSLPIIGLVIYYGTRRSPAIADSEPAAANTRDAEPAHTPVIAEPTLSVSSSGTSAAVPAVSGVASASAVSMEIAPTSSCWISITVDGRPGFSGLMNAGDKRVIHAREQIVVNVGDAGAFAYTLNGRAGRPLGAPGEVVSQKITLANLNQFVAR